MSGPTRPRNSTPPAWPKSWSAPSWISGRAGWRPSSRKPWVGATAGALPPVRTYLRRIRQVCDRHGVLLILDEVMSGMGRTGHLYACAEDGVAPDILTIAKGLGAGYQPIGAMLASRRLYDTLVNGSGFFQHGHTYMGHATACAAALAVQRVIERDGLLSNVLARGEQLRARLREVFSDHPNVGDVRGRGLFVGVEFVATGPTSPCWTRP